jgi:hypothetical protein
MIPLTTTPARLRAWRVFCVLGRSYLPRISGNDPITESRSVKPIGRDVAEADMLPIVDTPMQ